MAGVSWAFGPTGWSVSVSTEQGGSSTISGTGPMEDIEIRISPLTGDAATTRSERPVMPVNEGAANPFLHQQRQMFVAIHTPVQIDMSGSSTVDDTSVQASFTVTSAGISGKGSGKGIGKATRSEPAR